MSVTVHTRYQTTAHLRVLNLSSEQRERLAVSLVEAMKRRDPRLNPEIAWGDTSTRDFMLEVRFILKDDTHTDADRRAWSAVSHAIRRLELGDHVVFRRRDIDTEAFELASS